MCFIVTGMDGKTESWYGYRSIEVLSFHKELEKTEILFLLYIRNEKEGNYLKLLHPGNVSCEAVDFQDGLPKHQDELRLQELDRLSILDSIYRWVFEFDQDERKFHLKKILTSWDSLFDIVVTEQEETEEEKAEREEILIWNDLPNKKIEPLCYAKDMTRWAPFSAWTLGPFPTKGNYFVAVKATFSGESYSRLVNSGPSFLVEGPRQLQSKLNQVFIPYFTKTNQEDWQKKLSTFENYLRFHKNYDVVILDDPYADKVIANMEDSYMINKGPLVDDMGDSYPITECPSKPVPKKSFQRYITANSSFKLELSYADTLIEDMEESFFAENQPELL